MPQAPARGEPREAISNLMCPRPNLLYRSGPDSQESEAWRRYHSVGTDMSVAGSRGLVRAAKPGVSGEGEYV